MVHSHSFIDWNGERVRGGEFILTKKMRKIAEIGEIVGIAEMVEKIADINPPAGIGRLASSYRKLSFQDNAMCDDEPCRSPQISTGNLTS